jgi:hypothetical protein
MTLGSTEPLTEMRTRNLPGGTGLPARKADKLHPPGRFTPGTRCRGGWVDPRAGLDDMENLEDESLS